MMEPTDTEVTDILGNNLETAIVQETHRRNEPFLTELSFSPASRRRRLKHLNQRNIKALIGTSPPKAIVHVPRDPTQPRSGSITDVHSEASLDDEEADDFCPLTSFRPRSQTCPENYVWQRKTKVRTRNRPPTPPPGGVGDQEIHNQLTKLTIREKFHLNDTDLPSCIPEDNDGKIVNDEMKKDMAIYRP